MVKRVDCRIKVAPECRLGVYANAFRIRGEGDERTLDFLWYSDVDNVASLVSCVTVHTGILPEIQAHLGETLTELPAEGEVTLLN